MEEEEKVKKSSGLLKFFWNALDRIVFIGVGVLGTIAATYVTGMIKINPPELVVEQTYNRVDERPVASSVGGLRLDYQKEAPLSYGIYRIDIRNEGRGSAEAVRFQVKISKDTNISYYEEPDLKVYKPELVEFKDNEFYAVIPKYPSGADDYIILRIEGDGESLCNARVKLVSDDYEGKVGRLKGMECD